MTGCEKYIELISASIDGEISEADRSALEIHLEFCPECRKAAEALAAISGNFPREAPVPENFTEGTMAKIRSVAEKPTGFKRFTSGYGKYTGLAAALVVILLGAHVFTVGSGAGKEAADTAVRMDAANNAPMAAADTAGSCTEAAEPESMIESAALTAAPAGERDHITADGYSYDAGEKQVEPATDDACEMAGGALASTPPPSPDAAPLPEESSAPQFAVTVAVTDIEQLYAEHGYTLRFYSVSQLNAPLSKELESLLADNAELLYDSDDEAHYSVAVTLLHDIDPEAFSEIVFDDLTAEYGLIVLNKTTNETEDQHNGR